MKTSTKVLAAGAVLVLVFGASFLFFYKRAQKKLPKQPLILTSAVINQPLPKADLINGSGQGLDDSKLRKGRIILVFVMPDCQPCDQEDQFLKTVIGIRKDINFIYVIPFGSQVATLKSAQGRYASEAYYDRGRTVSKELEMTQVPIKIFLEDGIIKKIWLDATVDSQAQNEFKTWLTSL
jgi:hypothetical protein